MSILEIPVIDYFDLYEDCIEIYIHTKEERIIGLRDVQGNPVIHHGVLSIDHNVFGTIFTFIIPISEFSHLEYRSKARIQNEKLSEA